MTASHAPTPPRSGTRAMARATQRPADGRPPGPDPSRLAEALVRGWIEIRAGRRGFGQLRGLVTPAVRARLGAVLARQERPMADQRPRIRTVHASMVHADACEASVVVDDGDRVTAVAVRLERHRGAWRAVELVAPEAGLPPLRTRSAPTGHRLPDAFDEVLGETDGTDRHESPDAETDAVHAQPATDVRRRDTA